MITDRTVFIIGAAASLDFGFPLGADFKSQIAELLNWDEDSVGAATFSEDSRKFFRTYHNANNTELHAAKRIRLGVGFASSIDSYLEMWHGDSEIVECGKAAIGYLLMKKERDCAKLKVQSAYDLSHSGDFDATWLQVSAEICFQSCKRSDLPESLSRFSIISFNYDRCFEQFIRIAIASLYDIGLDDADALCTQYLTILYPYGSLGPLSQSAGHQRVAFGDERQLPPEFLSRNIRIFSESATSEYSVQVEKILDTAQKVVFLGFGYHRQNIDLLISRARLKDRVVVGTARGLSDRATVITKTRLKRALQITAPNSIEVGKIELYDLGCREFMEEQLFLADN